jgi:hypothetical protein
VKHDRCEESRLTLGEARIGDRLSAFVERHRSSSMIRGDRPPPRPPPLDPDQYSLKPELDFEAACAPR